MPKKTMTDLENNPTGPHLYQVVMQQVSQWIESGHILPGEKLPSVRKLSKQLGVSIATVVFAYQQLEIEGFIEARERSGYLVLAPRTVEIQPPQKSAPAVLSKKISIHDIVLSVAELADDWDYVPLGASTLSPDLMPSDKLKKITTQVVKASQAQGYFYEFIPGNQDLMEQLAKQTYKWGFPLNADDFVITSGAMEALQIAIRAVAKPGDTIAVESPTFYPILQTLENLNMFALEIPTDPVTGVDLEVLAEALQKETVAAGIFITNFNNPLGFVMADADKARLVALFTQHRIPLIEDDIYADLYFGETRPKPLKAWDTEGWVLYCSSISKTLCSGFRVGWMAPGRFLEDVKRIKYYTNVSTPSLFQQTTAECFRAGLYEKHVAQLRKLFKYQQGLYLEAISQYFPPDTRVTQPKGGFLYWVELPDTRYNALDLYKQALQKGFTIAPGPIFSAVQEYQHCLRLSGGLPWSDKIEKTLATLGKLLKTH